MPAPLSKLLANVILVAIRFKSVAHSVTFLVAVQARRHDIAGVIGAAEAAGLQVLRSATMKLGLVWG